MSGEVKNVSGTASESQQSQQVGNIVKNHLNFDASMYEKSTFFFFLSLSSLFFCYFLPSLFSLTLDKIVPYFYDQSFK